MRFGVLGTGGVGQTLATKLVELDHDVMMGARQKGNEKAVAWADTAGSRAREGSFADAAAFGEIIINATAGSASVDALTAAGTDNIGTKVLIDVSNPLDFSEGMPPTLTVCNADSLGEQIQRAFPNARVVKTLNTINSDVMVNPQMIPGDHVLFVSGNDGDAKKQVAELLGTFGWPAERVIDMGDLTSARATEMYVMLWIRLMGPMGGPHFSIAIEKAS
ncbi:MAG: 8-hydroxy-5-deazaflavin:NADPH oxidoreductase [Actinomycetota bacterium]|nr:8-hydroxy-5-deazaflavin:NADPH oxidoreductase [Actinomycetota bacterium]MEA2486712.1 8-hydroxy-5-deazaflavin:NADPH oxidoreductase [Actinomycetota bacterium]